jgi:toxin ParE1/3/4
VYKVELLSQAEVELADAYDWYKEQQQTLGNKLYNEVNYYLTLLEQNPYQFPIKYTNELRPVVINKFPYLIIYWIDEDNKTVFVVSIFHTSRKPDKLKI